MKNKEAYLPLNRSRDVGNAREKSTNPTIEKPPGHHVPMNTHPYNSHTVAEKKDSFKVNAPGYQHNLPNNGQVQPDGRSISGYKQTVYRSDTAVFKEGGRTVKRDQAVGKVIVKTNHPNKDLNKIYG